MGIPGAANPLLLRTAAAGGYSISRSLRFNSSDSAYLSRTPASAGNRKTWTLSFWAKRGASTGSDIGLFSTYAGSNPATACAFNSNDGITFYNYSGSYQFQLITTQVFRDYSAWYHLTFVVDTTQATSSNRVKLYVNGAQVTTFSTETYPSQNVDTDWNSATEHQIGNHASYFSGYLADIHFIDGQALTPSSFGEFDANGIWQPKAYTGTYGTNGFQLKFADNSAATATTLGKDTSGNGNHWSPQNLSVTNGFLATFSPIPTLPGDAFDGSPTTYAYGPDATTITFSPPLVASANRLDLHARSGWTWTASTNLGTVTLTDNGTTWPGGGSYAGWHSYVNASLTTIYSISVSAGANWTIQGVQIAGSPAVVGTKLLVQGLGQNDSLVDSPTNGTASSGGDAGGTVVGNYCTLNPLDQKLTDNGTISNGNLDYSQSSTGSRQARATFGVSSGKWYWEFTHLGGNASHGIAKSTSPLSSFPGNSGDNDGISWFAGGNIYRNGSTATYSGLTYTTNDVIGVALDLDAGSLVFYKNGVNQGTAASSLTGTWFPAFGSSSVAVVSFTANFGQRPFAYAAPSGFKSLNTANLPTPTILKGSDYFDTKLYTGNGSTQTISGLAFSPDLVWGKNRGAATSHQLYDTVRGAGKVIYSNSTAAEEQPTDTLSAFTSSGFTLDAAAALNVNTNTYAAWCWDAGSSNSTNTQGSITSTVRANPSAGFSIVTYSAGASGATVGHGLGAAPGLIIVKSRTVVVQWVVYHSSLGKDKYLHLDLTNSEATSTNYWGSATPNSTIFGLSISGFGNNTGDMVAYCFAPVAGYSSFGSYTGNGSTDGPFVFCNFRPRWILLKDSTNAGSWELIDTSRLGYNGANYRLFPNLSDAEFADHRVDILSNGFKLRVGSGSAVNSSNAVIVFAAFAENPFSIARAR